MGEAMVWRRETPIPIESVAGDRCAVVHGNKIYVMHWGQTTLYIYDTETQEWSTGPEAPWTLGGTASLMAAIVGDEIFCFPGYLGDISTQRVHIFNISTQEWSVVSTGKPRSRFSDEFIPLVFGTNIHVPTATYTHIFDTQTRTWIGSAKGGGNNRGQVAVGNKVYILGLYGAQGHVKVYDFDTEQGYYTGATPNYIGQDNFLDLKKAACVANGTDFYILPFEHYFSFKAWRYDTLTDIFFELPSGLDEFGYFPAVIVGDKLYAIGALFNSTVVQSLNIGDGGATRTMYLTVEMPDNARISGSYAPCEFNWQPAKGLIAATPEPQPEP